MAIKDLRILVGLWFLTYVAQALSRVEKTYETKTSVAKQQTSAKFARRRWLKYDSFFVLACI